MDGRKELWTDRPSYRDARMHLKMLMRVLKPLATLTRSNEKTISVVIIINKAGYTAISRVRVGRGSNAQKSTKKLFFTKT